jgi:hypothetical protein
MRSGTAQIGTIGIGPNPFIEPALTGAPYSAEETQEHVQTLSDGTHIMQTNMHRKIYRDSQGADAE